MNNKGKLELRCIVINKLFEDLQITNSRIEKQYIVTKFRNKYPSLNSDLDFCFEVLAGNHKLGYTYGNIIGNIKNGFGAYSKYENLTIKEFVELLKCFDATYDSINTSYLITPPGAVDFIKNLVNREFRLGYSNKGAMINDYSPMLAKKYPETFSEKVYYIQEKLDGNRCIAYYANNRWNFKARSGKSLNVYFDMSWADKDIIYDGEVMTLGKAGTRDFNHTSGIINGKYTDKSALHYFIYDIIDTNKAYKDRKKKLEEYSNTGEQCSILPVIAIIYVHKDISLNSELDRVLDYIVNKGGEGIILRDPDGVYEHKRSDYLLKYKKVKTMDLRIIGTNEGNGKYEGAIGSFICETDDKSIIVNVAGMPDDIRFSNPQFWIGKIIEVAYFDISKSKENNTYSLRFPRYVRLRTDKTETSIY